MDNIHITALYGAVSALAAGLSWVVKLFYVDMKASLKQCEERHIQVKKDAQDDLEEERTQCKESLQEHKDVINKLQGQVNTLTTQMVTIIGKTAKLESINDDKSPSSIH